jgi:hypothetical protein
MFRRALLLIVPCVAMAAEPAGHAIVAYRDLLLVTAPAPAAQLPPGLARQRLSVDFRETPMSEVAEFLRHATGLNVVLVPADLGDRAVTFTATDMELGHLLRWIRTVGRVHIEWLDGALAISESSARPAAVTRAYDVSDLTMTIRDFPGPDVAIPTGSNGAVLIAEPVNGRPTPTAEDLAALIEDVIAR